jgi:hypothetical protein
VLHRASVLTRSTRSRTRSVATRLSYRHYSYVDALKVDKAGTRTLPGGISFTHDQGAHNNFSPHGHSS